MSTNTNGGRPSKSTAEGVNDIPPFGQNSPANPPKPTKKRGITSNKGGQEGTRSINK